MRRERLKVKMKTDVQSQLTDCHSTHHVSIDLNLTLLDHIRKPLEIFGQCTQIWIPLDAPRNLRNFFRSDCIDQAVDIAASRLQLRIARSWQPSVNRLKNLPIHWDHALLKLIKLVASRRNEDW